MVRLVIWDAITPIMMSLKCITLRWHHNGCDSVSNHQTRDCLLSRLFRRRSKKTWKLRVTGLCVGNSPGPVNFPHKGPVTRKMFPFDDVIMKVFVPGVLVYVHSEDTQTIAGHSTGKHTLIARFMGPTWGQSGADRTQVGPYWPHELCYLGSTYVFQMEDVSVWKYENFGAKNKYLVYCGM